ncbi:nucleotidyltransferase family protein [Flavobacteriales bacterium]|nr:nucleotidyltransferase family protein [Flavobacteriales bacterium]
MKHSYPSSFPNSTQLLFLKTVLASPGEFRDHWNQWKSQTDLDTIDNATFRLLPTLYLRIRQEEGFEDEWVGRIKGVYKQGWAKNQLLLSSTSKVASFLSENGIPSILLKGVSLLLGSYKDVGGRMMGDVDMLIPSINTREACELMLANGWKCRWQPEVEKFSEKDILFFTRVSHEVSFINTNKQVVDLHFVSPFKHVFDPKLVSLFWETALPVQLRDVSCKILSPELTFLHVCYHGSVFNTFPSYRWVIDGIKTIESVPEFDWKKLIMHSERLGFKFQLSKSVLYLNEHFDFLIPSLILKELTDYQPTPKERSRYRKTTENSRFRFVKLPILWGEYCHSDPLRSPILKPYYFLNFLRESFRFDTNREVFQHYFKRFAARLIR